MDWVNEFMVFGYGIQACNVAYRCAVCFYVSRASMLCTPISYTCLH